MMWRLWLFVLVVVLPYPLLMLGVALLRRFLPPARWCRVASVIVLVASIYPALLLGLSLLHVVFPQRNGLLALSQVLAPYLFLPALALIPFAFLCGAAPLRWALALCLLVFGLRFLPLPRSSTAAAAPGTFQFEAMNWNVVISGRADQQARVRQLLGARPAEIVALV